MLSGGALPRHRVEARRKVTRVQSITTIRRLDRPKYYIGAQWLMDGKHGTGPCRCHLQSFQNLTKLQRRKGMKSGCGFIKKDFSGLVTNLTPALVLLRSPPALQGNINTPPPKRAWAHASRPSTRSILLVSASCLASEEVLHGIPDLAENKRHSRGVMCAGVEEGVAVMRLKILWRM
jgi:hypothetical protein